MLQIISSICLYFVCVASVFVDESIFASPCCIELIKGDIFPGFIDGITFVYTFVYLLDAAVLGISVSLIVFLFCLGIAFFYELVIVLVYYSSINAGDFFHIFDGVLGVNTP